MQEVGPSFRATAPWLWAALSVAAVVAATLTGFVIGVAAASAGVGRTTAGNIGVRLDLALMLAVAGALSLAGVLAAARLAFGRWLAIGTRDLVLPLVGVGLAVTLELMLHEWASGRFGYYDSDMIGPTAVLSPLVVLSAIATFGALVAPRGASTAPVVVLVLVAGVVCIVALSNVPGLRDGLESESWALAICVWLSVVYVLVGIALAWRGRRG